MSRSDDDMMMWAWGFISNAEPMVKEFSQTPEAPWGYESALWIYAFENKFKPAFFEWLEEYGKRENKE
jgi:hypothetical protein